MFKKLSAHFVLPKIVSKEKKNPSISSLNPLFGSIIWKHYLEALFGSITWKHYLEALFGSVIWKRYLEALGIFQYLRKRLLESFEVFGGFLIHLALSVILSSNNANRLSIIFKQGRMENKGS